jgi:hypothetical protein
MNTLYEHHKSSINFAYRCFDRILLNGLIQPFQQPGVDPTRVSSAAILTFSRHFNLFEQYGQAVRRTDCASVSAVDSKPASGGADGRL